MSYLYVTEHGATIGISGGYITVKHKDGLIQNIPLETLESVALFANVTITIPCTKELLKRGIPVSYFSSTGSYFGRLNSTRHTNVFRLKKQIYLSDNTTFRLEFTKKILKAKINNQIVLLRRYARNTEVNVAVQIKDMLICEGHLNRCTTVEQCMGYEGNASRSYFKALALMVDNPFRFNGRSKMPPRDAFNSMLSLGYTILMYEIYGEIENKGLNPYIGFMHKDKERHPSLASDLMEEWRAVIVDSTVMSIVMGNEINIEHFITYNEEPGVFLDKEAMKMFINKYEKKLRNVNRYLGEVYGEMSYRKELWMQVNRLTKAIDTGEVNLYEPVVIR